MGYTLADKDVMIGGSDESYVTDMEVDMILQSSFPQTDKEALVAENAQKALGLSLGDTISIHSPDGEEYEYTISGFSKMLLWLCKKTLTMYF